MNSKPTQVKKPNLIKKKMWASLDASPLGFSFRKLISIVILACAIYIHVRFVDTTNAIKVLSYDYAFICILLGLLNLDRFLELKFGKKTDTSESTANEPQETVEDEPIIDGDPIDDTLKK